MPVYQMPFCRVENVLQAVIEGRLCTLLVKRAEEPYKGFWGLPGGVLRIDIDKTLDAAALRVAKERLNVTRESLQQLAAVGAAGRDPRGENDWGLSVVYYALVPESSVDPQAGKRVSDLKWFPVDDPLPEMAFDHGDLVTKAVETTRSDIANLKFPRGFVPERFTLSELQLLCEQALGSKIDKASFRRKLRDRALVEPAHGEQQRGGAHRPAAVFQLTSQNLSK